MRRLLASALCLVLTLAFIAIIALWLRSYSRLETAYLSDREGSYIDIVSRDGVLEFACVWMTAVWPTRLHDFRSQSGLPINSAATWFPFTFRASRSTVAPDVSRFDLDLPHWALALLTGPAALASARWLRRLARRARRRRGLCLRCGYDLRATPERCPECGTAYTTASESARPAAESRS